MLTWQELIQSWLDSNDRSGAWLSSKTGYSRDYLRVCMRGTRRASNRFLYAIEMLMGVQRGTLVDVRTEREVEDERDN